ncbi:MAG: response regulator, partial [Planctomycetes bacterium]|nr:response regulator [Planctomycetota bacterium]
MILTETGATCPRGEFLVEHCLASGQPVTRQTLGIHLSDGDLRWAIFGAAPADDGGAVLSFVDVTELKRVDAALRLGDRRFRSMFERHSSVMLLIDAHTGAIVEANVAAERFYGWPLDRLRSMYITDLVRLPAVQVHERLAMPSLAHRSAIVSPHRLANGEIRKVEMRTTSMDYRERQVFFAIVHDVTERERLETELRQSQKHEAIGQIAGGVAHDFNNTLTVINGSLEELLEAAGDEHPWTPQLVEMYAAGSRAAELTRKLLAFSRKELLQLTHFDLNRLIRSTIALLGRVIGEHIEIVADLDPHPCPIKADARSLEQALINVALNSKEAIGDGGTITISTRLESGYRWSPNFLGPRVVLEVRDDGEGMDEGTVAHAFEPFFTTKGEGAIGLGLATVYSIVHQARGRSEISSRLGEGTTVRISFRVARDTATVREHLPHESTVASVDLVDRPATVLVVEDDDGVRNLAKRALRRHGYRVWTASRGDEALEVIERHSPGAVDLLVTDVVMPGMGGPELLRQVRTRYPDVKCFFVSGYSDDAIEDAAPPVKLLSKPFTPSALLEMTRVVLAAEGERDAPD